MANGVKFVASDRAISAKADINRMLKRIGCDGIVLTDDIERCELRLSFHRHGIHVDLPISARTWTEMFLRLRPWQPDNRLTEKQYRDNATRQGLMAVSPMLRTWLWGQVLAVENGLIPFERAFQPGIETQNRETEQ